MQKIKVKICPNYFDRTKQIEYEIDYREGISVNEILLDIFPSNFPVAVSVNGKIIEESDYFLAPDEQVVFIPKIFDGGNLSDRLFNPLSSGHDPLEAIKRVIGAYNNGGSVFDQSMDAARFSIQAIPGAGGLADWHENWARNNPEIVKAGLAVMGIAGGTWGRIGAFVLNYAANRYGIFGNGQAPSIPHIPGVGAGVSSSGGGGGMGGGGGGGDSSTGFVASNSYAWNPVTLQQLGACIPKIYGTFRTKGNLINGYISTIVGGEHPGDQVLNALILLCQGPIPLDGITSVKVNNKDLSSFNTVTANYRYGDAQQFAIRNFNDTYRQYTPPSAKMLWMEEVEYTTEGNDFDALKITVTFPQGLYFVKPVRTELHYEPVSITWTEVIDGVSTQKTAVTGSKYLGSTTYGGDTVASSVIIGIAYRKHGEGAWIPAPGDSGLGDSGQYVITEQKTSSFSKEFKIDNLENGFQYDISVNRITADSVETGLIDDVYFTGVTEIIKDDFYYPRCVLVGLEALATNQLSGSLDFSCLVHGSIVRVWNGTAWVAQWTDNPAWVAYDILTQPVFSPGSTNFYKSGLSSVFTVNRYDGIDPAYIDTASFKAWADFCDELVPDGSGGTEKRFVFNGIFDKASSVWDCVLEVCKMSRAMVYIRGYKYYAVFDNVATPVQMFTSGNILADSFEETFLSLDNRATEIEVDFANEDNDYKRETITIIDPNATKPKQLTTEQLIGCTKMTQAWRVGRYRLYNNQYITRFIKFDADIDAIACNIGDLIYFAHDLPQWGYSGRVVSATPTTVVLDRTVSMTEGVTYAVRIRLSDDTIVYKTTTGTGSTDTLTVSEFAVTPSEFDIYTFGIAGLEYKPFRINKIQPNPELTFTIEASEYNATIYNCDTDEPALPTPNYSDLNPVPQVTNVVLSEIVTKKQDGVIVDNIDVYWDRPLNFSWVYAEVWYKSVAMPGYVLAGRSYTDRLRIANLPLSGGSEIYTVKVVSVNSLGQKLPDSECPTEELTLLGMSDPPSDVSVFYAEQINDQVRLDWTHIEDADLLGYEIRVGNAWDSGTVIGSKITDDFFLYRPELDGTYAFFICAIDRTGHYSPTPKSVICTVSGVTGNLNVIYDHDYVTTPASGTAFNFTPGTGTLCSGENGLIFTTSAGTGYYMTNYIDMLKTGVKTVRMVNDIDATEDATDLTFPDRTDLTYPDDTDLHITAEYFRYPTFMCTDSTGSADNTFQPYFGPVSVNGRYFRFREDYVVPSQTAILSICEFRCIIDVPETKYKIPNVTIAEAGTTVTFANYGLTFYETPLVQATVLNSTIPLAPSISSRSATSCVVKLLDIAGGARAGNADINLFGY